MGRRKNKSRGDSEGNGRRCGGVAESAKGEADAVNLRGIVLHSGEIFSSSPKSNPGIEGGYLE